MGEKVLTNEGEEKEKEERKERSCAHARTQRTTLRTGAPTGGWTHRTMLRFPGTAEEKRSVFAPPLPAHKGQPARFDAQTVD